MTSTLTPPNKTVFWQETVQMPSAEPLRPIPDKVDVAVIGGGYTGLSAGRTFALGGATVAVLEAETIGWGASSRNGGMALTGLKLGVQDVAKRYGVECARQLFRCSLESVDTVEQIIEDEHIECDFSRHGHLAVANKPKHYSAMAREVEFLAQVCDYTTDLLASDALHEEIESPIYHGAIRDTRSAGLNPARFVAGLARAAEGAGAQLHPFARVRRLTRITGGFRAETTRGTLQAGRVVVATAGYTGRATRALQRRLVPIGSYIVATERLAPEIASTLIPRQRMVFDSMHFLNYFRVWGDRLIFGGRAAFLPENASTIHRSAELLRADMLRVFPRLGSVRVEYVWGGTLDFAFDMMPHVGEADGMLYALGYAGHGVAMGTYLGKTLAAAALAGRVKEHPFASLPFPTAPLGLYDGRPWFLPLAGLYFRFLDRLN